ESPKPSQRAALAALPLTAGRGDCRPPNVSSSAMYSVAEMIVSRTMARGCVRIAAVAMLAILVAACAGDRDIPLGEPSFYRNMAESGAQLDAATAASMISGYRTNNGLTAVTVDP